MAVNDIFRVEVQIVVDGLLTTMRQTYRCTNDTGATDPAEELAVAWAGNATTNLLAVLGYDCQLAGIRVHRIYPGPINPGVYSYNESTAVGTGATSSYPANVALEILFRVDSGSGRRNGRVYISGIMTQTVAVDAWSNTFVTGAANALAATLLLGLVGTNTTWEGGTAEMTTTPPIKATGVFHKYVSYEVRKRISRRRGRTARTIFEE